jgi:hypothetical protein
MVNLVQSLIAIDAMQSAVSFYPTPWGSRQRTGWSGLVVVFEQQPQQRRLARFD